MSIDSGMDKEDVVWNIIQLLKENEIMSFAVTWMDLEKSY